MKDEEELRKRMVGCEILRLSCVWEEEKGNFFGQQESQRFSHVGDGWSEVSIEIKFFFFFFFQILIFWF
jgi:hypothetical protein